jgi:hypothetical protein
VWSDENSYMIQYHHQQQQFAISVWAWILGDCLVGCHILLAAVTIILFQPC